MSTYSAEDKTVGQSKRLLICNECGHCSSPLTLVACGLMLFQLTAQNKIMADISIPKFLQDKK